MSRPAFDRTAAADARPPRQVIVTSEDLDALLDPTDHSMAVFFERYTAGHCATSPEYGTRCWDGRVWRPDSTRGLHRAWAIETVHALMDAAETIPLPASLLVPQDSLASPEENAAPLRQRMRTRLKKYERGAALNAMLDMAARRRPCLVPMAAFDADPWALTVGNGVLDLQTGDLTPATPERRLTKGIAVPYDPGAICPRFTSFLAELFPTDTEEMVTFLQQFLGSALTGVIREHLLPIFWGTGANGKTTLLRVLRALFDEYYQIAPLSLLLDDRHRTSIPNDIARLAGVRLVVVSETPPQGRLAEERFKVLTGGDPLTGRFLHHEFFDFDPTHKLIVVTNSKPVIKGAEHATWRRIALVPFTTTFWTRDTEPPDDIPRADPTLADTLLTELPGILAWCVEGCLAWQAAGALALPRLVQVATAEYQEESDTLGDFLAARCVIERGAWGEAEPLYAAYVAETSPDKPMTQTMFGRELTNRGFKVERQRGKRGRSGLRLRTPYDPAPGDGATEEEVPF
jgi:putative DNA primase/helicase